MESIVPTIYKSYLENYKIVFDEDILPEGVYQKVNTDGTRENVYVIDLESSDISFGAEGNDLNKQKEEFIKGILYGSGAMDSTTEKNFRDRGILLNSAGIYGIIAREKLIEKLGVYYQEEITPGAAESVPDADKHLKRVVTYEKK